MKVGPRSLILVATIITAVFLRFGFWQLSRLRERQALNAELASRAVDSAVAISGLPADTANSHYRRVSIQGAYDYANEIVLTLRSRDGSPGVNIVTPVKLPATDTAVLLVRGWIYSPDGMTVDLSKWREGAEVSGSGFVETYPPPRGGINGSPTHPNAYRWLDRQELEKHLHYPLKPYYVVVTSAPDDTTKSTPPRLTVPPMDEGPHRSYAIQWFSFAAISIIGTILFLRRK
ncbi:MAG TPA: SURF1 family protein [Gemmatimonadaceae bacterium]